MTDDDSSAGDLFSGAGANDGYELAIDGDTDAAALAPGHVRVGPQAKLAAGAATPILWTGRIKRYKIQNNTDLAGAGGAAPANLTITRMLDVEASAGHLAIRPGQTLSEDCYGRRLWLYNTGAASIGVNDGTPGSIVLEVEYY